MNATQILDATTLSAQYDLGQKCRARHIIAHPCSTRNLFYASTSTLKDQNKTHLIEFKEEENKINCLEVYENEGIIRQVVPDIHNEDNFYTIYSQFDANGNEKTGFNLKKSCVDGKGEEVTSQSQPIFNKSFNTYVHSLVTRLKDKNKIYFGETNHLNVFDIQKQEVILKSSEGESGSVLCDVDPHHNDYVASAQKNGSILIHDIRTQKPEFVIKNAHRLKIHDLDFNPLKLYYFQSVGEDSTVKFWELRKPNLPMKVIDKFNNMQIINQSQKQIKILQLTKHIYIDLSNLSSIKYMISYQLQHKLIIINSFTKYKVNDGSLGLYRVISMSSYPDQSSQKEADGLIKIYDQHENTVYSVSWANYSSWVFASVSYQGNVIVNMVPSSIKHRILY